MESKCPDETARVEDDVNSHVKHVLQGTFSPDAVHLKAAFVICGIAFEWLQLEHFATRPELVLAMTRYVNRCHAD